MIIKRHNQRWVAVPSRCMAWNNLLISVLVISLSILFTAIEGSASVGIADNGKGPRWYITTPEGNRIGYSPDGPGGV